MIETTDHYNEQQISNYKVPCASQGNLSPSLPHIKGSPPVPTRKLSHTSWKLRKLRTSHRLGYVPSHRVWMGLLLLRLPPIEKGGRVHVYEFHFIKGTQLPSGLVAMFALQCPLLGYAYSELPDDSSIQPSSHLQLFVFLDETSDIMEKRLVIPSVPHPCSCPKNL